MRQRFKEFLIELGTNADLLSAFQSDPGKVLQGSGLSQREQQALRTADSREIRKVLRSEGDGSLTIVGAGFRPSQMTPEAESAVTRAGKVYFLVPSTVLADHLRALHPSAESLSDIFRAGKPRAEMYRSLVEKVLEPVRRGMEVAVAFHGHPGVVMYPAHLLLRQAKLESFPARMLPGISAADCLFAELGLDPGVVGCQNFDATDFLVHQRRYCASSFLLLWQAGGIGDIGQSSVPSSGLALLKDRLSRVYAADHRVILYEIALEPPWNARVQQVPLAELHPSQLSLFTTLLVPPASPAANDPEMSARLHFS